MAAEPKPPTGLLGKFLKRGGSTAPEATLTATSQIEPTEEFGYRTDTRDFPSYQNEPTGPSAVKPRRVWQPAASGIEWTAADYRNVALASALPLGIAVFNMTTLGKDPGARKMCENVPYKLPPAACVTLNLATTAPLGLASYLVWNSNKENSTVALGIYGVTMAGLVALVPTFKSQCKKRIAFHSVALAALAAGTTCAYWKIDNFAGKLTLPFALWAAYEAIPWLLSLCPACSDDEPHGPPKKGITGPGPQKPVVIVKKKEGEVQT